MVYCWGLRYCIAREHIVLATVCSQNVKFCRDKMVRWGLIYCTAREHIVLGTVCGQNVKFSSCNPIHSMPSCLCRIWFFIQVTFLVQHSVIKFFTMCASFQQRKDNNFKASLAVTTFYQRNYNSNHLCSMFLTNKWQQFTSFCSMNQFLTKQ